jgi:hypothetical protein
MRPPELWSMQTGLPLQPRVQQPTQIVENAHSTGPPSSTAQLQIHGKFQHFPASQPLVDFTGPHHVVASRQFAAGEESIQDALQSGANSQDFFGAASRQEFQRGPPARSGTDTDLHHVAQNQQALPPVLRGPFSGASHSNVVSNLMAISSAHHSPLVTPQNVYQQQTTPNGPQQRSPLGKNEVQPVQGKQARRARPKKKSSANSNRDSPVNDGSRYHPPQVGGVGPLTSHEVAQSVSVTQHAVPSGVVNAPLSGGGHQTSQALDFLVPQQVQEFMRVHHQQHLNAQGEVFDIPPQSVPQNMHLADQQRLEQQQFPFGMEQAQASAPANQSETQRRHASQRSRQERVPKDLDKGKNRLKRSPLSSDLQAEPSQTKAIPRQSSSYSLLAVQGQRQDRQNMNPKSHHGRGHVSIPAKLVVPRPFDEMNLQSVAGMPYSGQEGMTQGATGLIAGTDNAGTSHLVSIQQQLDALQSAGQREDEQAQEHRLNQAHSSTTEELQRVRNRMQVSSPHHTESQGQRMAQMQPLSSAEQISAQRLQNARPNRSHSKPHRESPANLGRDRSPYPGEGRFDCRHDKGHDAGKNIESRHAGKNIGIRQSPGNQSQMPGHVESQHLPLAQTHDGARLSGYQLMHPQQHATSAQRQFPGGSQVPSGQYPPETARVRGSTPNGNCDNTSGSIPQDERNVVNQSRAAPSEASAMLAESMPLARTAIVQGGLAFPGRNVRGKQPSFQSEDRHELQTRSSTSDARRLVPALHSGPAELVHDNSQQNGLRNIDVPPTAVCPPFVNSIHAIMAANDEGRFDASRASIAEENLPAGHEAAGVPNLASGPQQSIAALGNEFMMGDVMNGNVPASVQDERGEADTEQHMVQSLFYGHGIGDGGRGADDDLSGDPDFGF